MPVPSQVRIRSPRGASQRTICLNPAAASSDPSGENVNAPTSERSPLNVRTGRHVAGSQITIVPSVPPVASARPSGEKEILYAG